MAGNNKHKERSKRSSHKGIPTAMFASKARWKKIAKQQMKEAKKENKE